MRVTAKPAPDTRVIDVGATPPAPQPVPGLPRARRIHPFLTRRRPGFLPEGHA